MATLILIFLTVAVLVVIFLVLLDKVPLEDFDWWLKAISIGLAGLTFVLGAFALITGQRLSDVQAQKIAVLDNETAKAKLAYLELYKNLQPRRLCTAFANYLEKNPISSQITILYQPGSKEASDFANELAPLWRTRSLCCSAQLTCTRLLDIFES